MYLQLKIINIARFLSLETEREVLFIIRSWIQHATES